MIVARVQVREAKAFAVDKTTITAGMVGAQVQLDYTDPVWDSLQKTVVFYGAAVKDIITDDTLVTIPAEVIARPNVHLTVGVYGVDAEGCVVIPTLLADLGTVRMGANPSGDTSTDPTLPVWAKLFAMIGNMDDLETTSKENLVAAVNEALNKGGGSVDEAEIQRIVEDFLSANPPTVTESDPTVPSWAKQPQKPSYSAQEVGADPAGTASAAVSQHNTDTAAHNDLRIALQELANRVNAALDSDDTTLDQLSEIVTYIKSNKTLIDAITTSKVSITDIVNDLVTNVADKPLSAAQGVALKVLIEELRTLIPEAYTLPTATETTLGGVKPVTATDAMTQPVGVTAEGRLVTKPGEGGSGISVTGATVGQTIRVAAVDDDGVPTAWVPADFPSGGGASIVCVQTELESGIIPSGEAAWSTYELNVTLADIQEWDEVLVEWYGMTTSSYWSFEPCAMSANSVSWFQGGSKQMYLYEWVDNAHTCIRVKSFSTGLGGGINGIVNSNAAPKSIPAGVILSISDWSSIDPTTHMGMHHNMATDADITYKVWGITKKGA